MFGYIVPDINVDVGDAIGADRAHQLVGATPCLDRSPSLSNERSLHLVRAGYDQIFYYIVKAINYKNRDLRS